MHLFFVQCNSYKAERAALVPKWTKKAPRQGQSMYNARLGFQNGNPVNEVDILSLAVNTNLGPDPGGKRGLSQ